MTTIQKNSIQRPITDRNAAIQEPSLFSPLDQVDSFVGKAVLATLIVLDKASFISPFRWFFPTANNDGKSLRFAGLYGCGGDQLKPTSEQKIPTPSVCTKDTDCQSPGICENERCVIPSEQLPPQTYQVDGGPPPPVRYGDKIGDRCRPNNPNESRPLDSRDCNTGKCITPTEYPGGYCTDLLGCSPYGEPPSVECRPGSNFRRSVCVYRSELGIDGYYEWWNERYYSRSHYYCVVTCDSDSDCRTDEGYTCKKIKYASDQKSFGACLPQYEEVHLGRGKCAE